MLKFSSIIKHCAQQPSTHHVLKHHKFVTFQRFQSFITFIDLSNPTNPKLKYLESKSYSTDHLIQDLEFETMSNQQQQSKPKKQKKKKLSKAERIALRQQQQAKSQPTLKHPDDGNFGDLAFNQSQYRVL